MLIGCRETLVRDRARGLVGYDVALTRRRSPVRIRPGPCFPDPASGSGETYMNRGVQGPSYEKVMTVNHGRFF